MTDEKKDSALMVLKGHTDWVSSVAVTPDGKRVVSGSYDKTLKVWDLISGKRVYLQLKSGDSHLKKRKKDGKEIFTIKKKRHAQYWVSQAAEYPVMLVIRNSEGEIRWMNVTDYLKRNGPRTKQVEFDGEPFTADSLRRLKNKL